MSMNDETPTPSAHDRKGRRTTRRIIYGGVAVVIAGVLAGGVKIATLALTDLDSRLTRLESRNSLVATTEQLSALQSDVKALQKVLAEGKQRVMQLQAKMVAQVSQGEDTTSLRQTLESLQETQQAQARQLKALTEQLNTLASKPASPQVKKTPEKKTPAVTPKPAANKGKSHPVRARRSTPVVRNAPFVLTGVERRGAESWAAVAPKGYSSLSQIALVGEGETVAGWTLLRAGYGQATFRVNGHTVRVNVQ